MGEPITGSISYDVAAREAHVLGDGQRIAAIPNDAIDQDAWDLVNAVRAGAGAGPTDTMPEYMRTLLKHPRLFRVNMDMGQLLYNGELPPQERELAILRCGWLCRAPFEWGEHVNIAYRVGMTAETIERATRGSSAEGWTDHERAIVRGTEELIADQALSDATWEVLARSWTDAQLIEFPMLVGQYVALAYVQNTLRTQLMEGNPGLGNR